MCLVDTLDGALMLTLYLAPAKDDSDASAGSRAKDPLTFLYYSVVLTTLTVLVALVIGTIQLLTLVLNVAAPEGPFWDGVQTASDNYDVIGGAVCGSFVVVGAVSVACYGPWRRRVDRRRAGVTAEAS